MEYMPGASYKDRFLTQDYLVSIFKYVDGDLFRKCGRDKGKKAGHIQGNRYMVISIKNKRFFAHRIIFLMHKGFSPPYVDHIDGDKSNNRFENLRACTMSQNSWNMKSKKSVTGVKGVHFYPKRNKPFKAEVWKYYKKHHVGYYSNLKDAELAVKIARRKLHGEFARDE